MYVVYALIDPRDNTIKYVGITNDVYERFQHHIRCDGSSFAKNAWVMELRAANKMVIMETLEEVETRELAQEREAYWIKHFEMLQEPLVNVSKRSSPRKAKKTNLRLGRHISLAFVQTVAHAVESVEIVDESARDSEQWVVQSPATPPIEKRPPENTQLQRVLEVYRPGMAHRALAKILGISHPTAGKLLQRLRDKNLIDEFGQKVDASEL